MDTPRFRRFAVEVLLCSLAFIVSLSTFILILKDCQRQGEPPATSVPLSLEDERSKWVTYWAEQVAHQEQAMVSPLSRVTLVPLALQISRAENYRGIPEAWSPNGCCVGVMQVHVRIHYGKYHQECGGSDLMTAKDNACYGVLILRDYLRECSRSVAPGQLVLCALGRYGGGTTVEARAAYVKHVRAFGTAIPAPTQLVALAGKVAD